MEYFAIFVYIQFAFFYHCPVQPEMFVWQAAVSGVECFTPERQDNKSALERSQPE